MVLDEVDLAIKANLESRGWLSLLEIDHPPLTALIKEFFSNLSCHVYDSNTLVRSWIRGVEFTITPRVVAEALRVPVVWEPVYPYDETPPLDVVMSYITGSSIQWGSNSRCATFLRQRAAHLRVNHSRPRGASSGVVPPPPSSTGANAANADVPPPTTSNDSDIRRTLDHVLTVQAAHG